MFVSLPRTLQGLHIDLKVGKDVNILLKDLVIEIHSACCAPRLLTQANSGRAKRRTEKAVRREERGRGREERGGERGGRGERVPVQFEGVLHSLVVGLLNQLLLEVSHSHSLSDDGVHQWLEELGNGRTGE